MNARRACASAVLALLPVTCLGMVSDLADVAFAHYQQRLQKVHSYVERVKGGEIPGMRMALPDGSQGPCMTNCVVTKVEIGTDGKPYERILSPIEVAELAGINPTVEFLNAYGLSLIGMQGVMNSAAGGPELGPVLAFIGNWSRRSDEAKRTNAGGPPPWLNPYTMLAAGGVMMLQTADALEKAQHSLANSAALAQSEGKPMAQAIAKLEPAGVEQGEYGPATRFSTAALDMPMGTVEGQQVTFKAASLLIDNDEYMIVSHRFEGTMQDGKVTRPFYVEVLNSDFRQVPDCGLYKPYRRVQRIGGILNDKERTQMEEAKAQLAQFERQLASMPPSQRAMMEGMMGSQMNMVRSMANGGFIEHVQEIEEIICNPDLKALFSPVDPAMLLARIQRGLVTLGYEPGNTAGVMDTLTEVAISQFEAERDMPVTGQPSTQLAMAVESAAAAGG